MSETFRRLHLYALTFGFTALTFFSACHTAIDGEIKDGIKYRLYPNGNIKAELSVDENGKRNGPATYYFENGATQQRANFVNDTLEGALKNYVGDETLYDEMFFKKGKLEGAHTGYHANGEIKFKGQYANDFTEGSWFYYTEDGTLERRLEFNHGNRDAFIEYYPDGSVKNRSAEIDVWSSSTGEWTANKSGTIALSTQHLYATDSAKVSLRIEGPGESHNLVDSTINGISYHDFTPKASGTYKVFAAVTDWVSGPEVIFRHRDTLIITVK